MPNCVKWTHSNSVLMLIRFLIGLVSVSTLTSADNTASTYRYLHLTDLHLDPYYNSNKTNPDTFCHKESQTTVHPSSSNLRGVDRSHYGLPGTPCDSPPSLVEDTFKAFRSADFGLDVDFVLWTGDNSRHDRDARLPKHPDDVFTITHTISLMLNESFPPSTIIIPSIGNWDVYPASSLPGADKASAYLQQLWDAHEPIFNRGSLSSDIVAQIKTDWMSGGYFSVPVIPGRLHVISVNTLYWFAENSDIEDCEVFVSGEPLPETSTKPGDIQFRWLQNRLTEIAERGEKVIIIGHVPPFMRVELYTVECYRRFVDLSGRFSSIILTQYYGHINKNNAYLLLSAGERSSLKEKRGPKQKVKDTQTPYTAYTLVPFSKATIKKLAKRRMSVVGTLWTSSSLVPFYNPGFMIGTISTASNRTRILAHEHYFADLERDNAVYDPESGESTLKFERACESRKDFSLASMDVGEWRGWIERLLSSHGDPSSLERYDKCTQTNWKKGKKSNPKEGETPSSPVLTSTVVWAFAIGSSVVLIASIVYYAIHARSLYESDESEREGLLVPSHLPEDFRPQ